MRSHQTGRVGSQQGDQPAQQKRHARTDGRGLQAGVRVGDVARAREGDAAGQIAIVVGIGVRAHGIGHNSRHAQGEAQRQQHGEHEDGAAGCNLFILWQACIQCAYRTNTSQLLMVRLPEATLPSSGVTRIRTRMLHACPPG